MFIINWARQRLKFENKVCVLFTCYRKVKIIFYFVQKLSKSSELHFLSTLQVIIFSSSNVQFQFNGLSEIFEDYCFRSELYISQQAILLIDALGFEPDIQADVKDFSLIYSDSGNFQSKQLALSTPLQLHFSVFHSHVLLLFLLTFLVQICLAKTFFIPSTDN